MKKVSFLFKNAQTMVVEVKGKEQFLEFAQKFQEKSPFLLHNNLIVDLNEVITMWFVEDEKAVEENPNKPACY